MPLDAAPLTLAQATLRLAQPHVSALSHVAALVSQYLDASHRFSLASAAASGSVRLLDRVAHRLLSDPQLHEAVRDHAFARAMEAAIKNDDLVIVKRIHELHPEPLIVKTLKAAMTYGSLAMVQWVVEHRYDRLCCAPGVANLCGACLESVVGYIGKQDTCRVVQWLFERGFTLAVASGALWGHVHRALALSVDLTRWCQDTGRLTQTTARNVLKVAVSRAGSDDLELIQYLVESGYTMTEDALKEALIAASFHRGAERVIEYVMGSRLCESFRHKFEYAPVRLDDPKIIQWKVNELSQADHNLYRRDAEGVRWLHKNIPSAQTQVTGIGLDDEQTALDLFEWLHANSLGMLSPEAMYQPAYKGFLRVVQWLHTTTSGHCSVSVMDAAAENGHLDVLRWLHANRTDGCSEAAMNRAATKGHLTVVQWLHANRTESRTTAAMVAAAATGQLEVLAWLHENAGDACTACCMRLLLKAPYEFTDEYEDALQVINTLKWLQSHLSETACHGDCAGVVERNAMSLFCAAVDVADLQLLEYLTTHHRGVVIEEREDPGDLYNCLGRSDHLSVVQWIYAHFQDDFDWQEVRAAADTHDNAVILTWLDSIITSTDVH